MSYKQNKPTNEQNNLLTNGMQNKTINTWTKTNIIRGSRKIRMICRGYEIKVNSKSQLIIKSLYSYLVYKLDQEH